MKPVVLALAAVVVTAELPAAAQTQPYPYKPIRYIVGFTPGTATDIVARIVGQKLSERWGQQVIVDNRVGAAGTISAAMVARADPDGYTLYMAASTFVVTPFLMPVTYDIFKDFAPVILMVDLPTVLIVPPQLGVNSVKELIALAKSKPGALNYADTGPGTSSQVGAELLRSLAGINLTQVSFKSAADALNGVVRGDIGVYYPNLAAALPLIKQRQAHGGRAGHPVDGRQRARFRFRHLLRHRGARAHAQTPHRQTECRSGRHPRAAGHPREAARSRRGGHLRPAARAGRPHAEGTHPSG